jgi:Transcriptional Coactivator p15 (PC4)
MSSCLVEPVLCAQFWRNRSGEALRVELRAIDGVNIVDVRIWRPDRDGKMQPVAGKGVSCTVNKLPELVRAIVAAQRRAEQIGLLPSPSAASRTPV